MVFNLIFVKNITLSFFFFFFLIHFSIVVVITQLFNTTAELEMPTGIITKKEKVKRTPDTKISNYSI